MYALGEKVGKGGPILILFLVIIVPLGFLSQLHGLFLIILGAWVMLGILVLMPAIVSNFKQKKLLGKAGYYLPLVDD